MKTLKTLSYKAAAGLVMLHASAYTFAAKSSLGANDQASSDIIKAFMNELAWWKVGLIAVFGFMGLYLAVTGIYGAIQANDQNKAQDFKMKTQVAKILGGVALISVAFLVMVIGNTFFGSGELVEQHYNGEVYRTPN